MTHPYAELEDLDVWRGEGALMRVAARVSTTRCLVLFTAGALAAACAPAPVPPGTVGVFIPRPAHEPGDIRGEDLAALGTRAHRLVAEPASLSLKVGDRYSLGALRVDALDARGERLGRLRVFDRGVTMNGVLELPGPGEVVAAGEGTDTLHVSYPKAFWRGAAQARPRTFVVVRVAR